MSSSDLCDISTSQTLPDVDKLTAQMEALQQLLSEHEQSGMDELEQVTPQEREIGQFFIDKLNRAVGAHEAWIEYLSHKYNLSPGDEVTREGWIRRRVPAPTEKDD